VGSAQAAVVDGRVARKGCYGSVLARFGPAEEAIRGARVSTPRSRRGINSAPRSRILSH